MHGPHQGLLHRVFFLFSLIFKHVHPASWITQGGANTTSGSRTAAMEELLASLCVQPWHPTSIDLTACKRNGPQLDAIRLWIQV